MNLTCLSFNYRSLFTIFNKIYTQSPISYHTSRGMINMTRAFLFIELPRDRPRESERARVPVSGKHSIIQSINRFFLFISLRARHNVRKKKTVRLLHVRIYEWIVVDRTRLHAHNK